MSGNVRLGRRDESHQQDVSQEAVTQVGRRHCAFFALGENRGVAPAHKIVPFGSK